VITNFHGHAKELAELLDRSLHELHSLVVKT
jgi:hypothetical protein